MVIERSMHPQFLSNTFLVGREGGEGFIVDAGGPVEPLIVKAQELAIAPTHVLLTHRHWDHVAELPALRERWPDLQVLIDPREGEALRNSVADLFLHVTGTMEAGKPLSVAGFDIELLHTPGHTAGMLNPVVEGNVFTGDTLFKNSVGGVRAPGSTSYEDLRSSVMDVLMALPPETVIQPGHTDSTTVGDEWESNSFIRIWRGLDPEGDEPCTALGEPATLVHFGDDYDGGHKAWVRWPDGRDDIVPGSKVERG
jgi:glyoxylase-like metal-dependent hydrolase (beta-lactamase superfamily II)